MACLAMWVHSDPLPARSLASALQHDPAAKWNRVVGEIAQAYQGVKKSESDELLVIAPYAQMVNLAIGRPGAIKAAGICQIWYQSEVEQVVSAISNPATRMVVIDTGFPYCGTSVVGPTDLNIAPILDRDYTLTAAPGDNLQPERRMFVRNEAHQSSSYAGSNASLAIDGNTDGIFAHGSVTHTLSEPSPYWELDLGKSTAIKAVEIWNRTDCCGERLRNYWVFTSNAPFLPDDTTDKLRTREQTFSVFMPEPAGASTTVEVTGDARYVRIQLQGSGYLSLAEVRVITP